ncbi:MAG: hypothetical protein AAGA03_18210, partial [Planctomycetota bacterium]
MSESERTIAQVVGRVARWGFAGLLMVMVLGYLTAGLSEDESSGRQAESNDQVSSDTVTTIRRTAERGGTATDEVATANLTDGQPTGNADPNDLDQTMLIADLNRIWSDYVRSASLEPAEQTTWLNHCRRMSLALVGSGLSLEEIRSLELLPEQERAETHLENLLSDSR